MNEGESPRVNSPWIERARSNARRRGGFMAGVFADYQERFQMTDEELARKIECAPDRIPVIALCQEPRLANPRFASDVREIAAYGGADPGKLAVVVREVNQLRRWTASTSAAGGIAAAARDAEADERPSVSEDHPDYTLGGEPAPQDDSVEDGDSSGPHTDPDR